jgi:hypothetical protein
VSILSNYSVAMDVVDVARVVERHFIFSRMGCVECVSFN